LTQDRCTVCPEHTISTEIILDVFDELLGDMGHVKYCFDPFRDGVSFGAR
jgi:hypothetical protein